jgi:hypothetical protein
MLGLFNPNIGWVNGHGLFGTAFDEEINTIRYYSLSTEPSYAGTIVVFFFYLYQKNARLFGESVSKIILIMVLFMLFAFNSGFGFLLMFILLWNNLKSQKPQLALLGMAILVFLFCLILVIDLDIHGVNRLKNLVLHFEIGDWSSIKEIDYNASFRIMPFYFYLKTIDFGSVFFYLGNGTGISDVYLSGYLFPHAKEDVMFQGGFLPGFLIDYGLVGFLLVIMVFIKKTKSLFSFGTLTMVLCLVNANFNTQLFWTIFTFLTLQAKILKRENTN